jgi:hypothetical protein
MNEGSKVKLLNQFISTLAPKGSPLKALGKESGQK